MNRRQVPRMEGSPYVQQARVSPELTSRDTVKPRLKWLVGQVLKQKYRSNFVRKYRGKVTGEMG